MKRINILKHTVFVLLWTLSGTTLASNAIDDILQSELVDDSVKEYLLNNTLDKDETINVLIGFEIENDEPSFTDTTEEYELKSGVVKYKVRSKNKYLSEDEINDYFLSKRQSRKIAREKRLKRLKSTADKFNQK